METARVEEVVGDFVTLKKRGANMIGLCPFHNEKTPSFTVSPAKGIYKCFGCGQAGNPVRFVMEHEHYSYPEALRYLAGKYNIELEETGGGDKEEMQAERNQRESLYIANTFAQKYFTQTLLEHEEGRSVGLSYFKERGFNEDIVEKFQLGYALEEPDGLYKAATEAGYQKEVLQQAGLIKEYGGKVMDFFRSRVQFTIHNFSGKVVGFGGRTLKSDKKIPKYINTAESEIYNKSKILYGAFFAKTDIRKQDECLLVEGYTDVISLHQAGIENVVASSGTSLTVEQVRQIKRLTPNITILYDGDAAGLKAAMRGIDLILEEDMNVKVVVLPDGEDPDSYVRSLGGSEFRAYMKDKAKDFIFFKTQLLLQDSQHDPVKKSEAVKDIVKSISLIPDTIKRSLYVRECSTLLGVDEQILITETNKTRRKQLQKDTKISRREAELIAPDIPVEHQQEVGEKPQSPVDLQEKDIVRLLLEYGQEEVEENITVTHVLLNELEDLGFENELYNTIADEYRKALEKGEVLETAFFLNHPNEQVSQLAIEVLHSPYEISDNWDKMHEIVITDKKLLFRNDIKSSLCRYKLRKVMRMMKANEQKIKACKDDEELMSLMRLQQQFIENKKKLANDLGTVVVY